MGGFKNSLKGSGKGGKTKRPKNLTGTLKGPPKGVLFLRLWEKRGCWGGLGPKEQNPGKGLGL